MLPELLSILAGMKEQPIQERLAVRRRGARIKVVHRLCTRGGDCWGMDNVRFRRAVQTAVNQRDYLDAAVGNPRYSAECRSFFSCDTPLGDDQSAQVMPRAIAVGPGR